MGSLTTNVSALLNVGADAMQNLYDIEIGFPAKLNISDAEDNSFQKALMIRSAGFTPPAFNVKMYDVKYKTITIKRVAPEITGNREFKISFRLDAYYNIYKSFLKWRAQKYVPSTGFASNVIDSAYDTAAGEEENGSNGADSSFLGYVKVLALAKPLSMGTTAFMDDYGITNSQKPIEETNALLWDFKQVWVSSMTEPQFKNGDAAAQNIEVTFEFGDFDSPLMQNQESTK
jgi:hypothetical protein